MTTILFSQTALDMVTPEQLESIRYMARPETNTVHIHCTAGALGLPSDYITFRREFKDNSIYGGIAPNGDVST